MQSYIYLSTLTQAHSSPWKAVVSCWCVCWALRLCSNAGKFSIPFLLNIFRPTSVMNWWCVSHLQISKIKCFKKIIRHSNEISLYLGWLYKGKHGDVLPDNVKTHESLIFILIKFSFSSVVKELPKHVLEYTIEHIIVKQNQLYWWSIYTVMCVCVCCIGLAWPYLMYGGQNSVIGLVSVRCCSLPQNVRVSRTRLCNLNLHLFVYVFMFHFSCLFTARATQPSLQWAEWRQMKLFWIVKLSQLVV